jgi:hypothetical protein
MFRRALFAAHGLRYSQEFAHAEDFELWTRVAEVTAIANLPVVLLHYREHSDQVSTAKAAKQDETVTKILLRQLRKVYPEASDAESNAHVAIMRNLLKDENAPTVDYVQSWLETLIAGNDAASRPFPRDAFRRALAIAWWRFCATRCALPGVLTAFFASELTRVLPLRNRLGILALRAKAMAFPA